MKSISIALLLFLASSRLYAQEWQSATDWKLYKFTTAHGRPFNRDSLPFYGNIALNTDSLLFYLQEARPIPREKSKGAVWMGDYWASCRLEDTTRIVKISHYGGFFVDIASGQYYELNVSLRSSWHDYFNRKYMSLLSSNNGN